MPIHHSANARVERHTAQVLKPSHADTFKTAVKRAREAFPRFVDRERRAGIRPCNRAQHERKVSHRPPQASRSTQCRPRERRLRMTPRAVIAFCEWSISRAKDPSEEARGEKAGGVQLLLVSCFPLLLGRPLSNCKHYEAPAG